MADTRVCGECAMCCKLLPIQTLGKPKGCWCVHAKAGGGCAIYADRPQVCRTYVCTWLVSPQLGPAWRPDRARFVLNKLADGALTVVEVDPAHPGAWRAPPYYAQIKAWSQAVKLGTGAVLVRVGQRAYGVFPEADIHLGLRRDTDQYLFGYRAGAAGPAPYVRIRDLDGVETEISAGPDRP